MYRPPAFDETRLPLLHAAIAAARLATLVAHDGDGLLADHLPLLLDPTRGPFGTLSGHLARANPQGAPAAEGRPVLAIFAGPDAYVSPSWYPSKAETHKVVPTWNYVAVHAHGRLRFFDDRDRLLALVTRLTEAHEAGRAAPWSVADAPPDFMASMLKGIVGFEIEIERLEGKRKLGQNRTPADRAGVIAGLAAEPGEAAKATAAAMGAAE
ncbi:FMN-binding negative transcriptional regulator [Siculibacillus lacustris]|uniref:FMN-binding negative transcriptional regulator n=1 Tax=Siculibacillus lacustris TaxID=1549641 RepID=A0A4Q9VW25_9HYPH|nr:FMN-binding negative transcriptional regulator [Siculibacillus lacustris]TBW39273.1 FMN-binding negative transcriptional regulator [Siculibacillus lacustris]